jgi:hypothetical protein
MIINNEGQEYSANLSIHCSKKKLEEKSDKKEEVKGEGKKNKSEGKI